MVGRWYFRVRVSPDFMYRDSFARVLQVALLKLCREPVENVEWSRSDYRGIYFKLVYRVPFYVERWS